MCFRKFKPIVSSIFQAVKNGVNKNVLAVAKNLYNMSQNIDFYCPAFAFSVVKVTALNSTIVARQDWTDESAS